MGKKRTVLIELRTQIYATIEEDKVKEEYEKFKKMFGDDLVSFECLKDHGE